MIEVARIALEESERGQFSLLCMKFLGFLKLQERAEVIGLRQIDDDHPFARLELFDEIIALKSGSYRDGCGHQEPEPGKTIALNEKTRGIEATTRNRDPVGGSGTGRFH